jgi:hypothetical protein
MILLKKVIMRRDGISSSEADSLIEEARESLQAYIADGDLEAAENVCSEFFNLEPDYLTDLL